jgi:REP element-mobilizing transposase RayT
LLSTPLERWLGFWKNNVARKIKPQINAVLWQREFWDRQLRSGDNYNQKWDYVRNNPVRHGYCGKAEDWPYQGEIHELRW